jgi:periplasmic copper chaperone A
VLALAAASAFGGSADIQVTDAWIRWLPADLPCAGYVTLINQGSVATELVGVSSPDYADVGMHQTRDNHGVSEMRPAQSIVMQPHETLRFAEGGYHLMLMQPTRSLHPGDTANIVFHWKDGRSVTVPFEVRSLGSP